MAIRFQCAACSEPIEVDDNWARQAVRCPYCQRTVTAPAESTLSDSAAIPVATGIRRSYEALSESSPIGSPDFAGVAVDAAPASNGPATAAFVLACLTLGLFALAVIVTSRNALEFQDIQEQMEAARRSGGSAYSAMMQYIQGQPGGIPTRLIALSLINLGAMTACVAAIILGVIGLFRPYRRALAVMALITSGTICTLLCLSAFFSLQ